MILRPWLKVVLPAVICVAFLLAAFMLRADAQTFALYEPDPSSGRAGGCYTLLDFALGHRSPQDWTRRVEYSGSWIATAASIATLLLSFRTLSRSVAARRRAV